MEKGLKIYNNCKIIRIWNVIIQSSHYVGKVTRTQKDNNSEHYIGNYIITWKFGEHYDEFNSLVLVCYVEVVDRERV